MISTNMPSLRVQIVRFVDEYQPGIVETQFRDSQGKVHTVIDKLPIFTDAKIWSDSEYPQPGVVRCRVLERIPGSGGDDLARITIADPDQVEAADGSSEFIVRQTDLLF